VRYWYIALVLVCGCASVSRTGREPVGVPVFTAPPAAMVEGSGRLGQAQAYVEQARAMVQWIAAEVEPTVRELLARLDRTLEQAREALARMRESMAEEQKERRAEQELYARAMEEYRSKLSESETQRRLEKQAADARYAELRGRLLVRIAVWVERMWILVLVAWLGLGALGVFLCVTGGGSGLLTVGRWILNMLPFSNMFAAVARSKRI